MAHFVHYVSRQVVDVDYESADAPWFAEQQTDDQGFITPAYHVTRATSGPVTRIAVGDTIWLFSQLRSPWGVLPPSLDAKINVTEVLDRRNERCGDEPAFRFTAGKGSRWFPLYNATDALMQLTTVDGRGKAQTLLTKSDQSIGQVLRRMRQLEGSQPLVALEQRLSELGFDFVSYRLRDGTRLAFEAVRELVESGRAVWWDRWSLPRRLAERREVVSDPALDEFIQDRIAASNTVFGIISPMYAERQSYSWKEMDFAEKQQKFRQWANELNG